MGVGWGLWGRPPSPLFLPSLPHTNFTLLASFRSLTIVWRRAPWATRRSFGSGISPTLHRRSCGHGYGVGGAPFDQVALRMRLCGHTGVLGLGRYPLVHAWGVSLDALWARTWLAAPGPPWKWGGGNSSSSPSSPCCPVWCVCTMGQPCLVVLVEVSRPPRPNQFGDVPERMPLAHICRRPPPERVCGPPSIMLSHANATLQNQSTERPGDAPAANFFPVTGAEPVTEAEPVTGAERCRRRLPAHSAPRQEQHQSPKI